jgi:hypothetical protein
MSAAGTKLESGKQVVPTAGTRVRMLTTATEFAAKTVLIQALGTNEGEIVVGGSNVVAAPGTHAAPTQIGTALAAKALLSVDIDDAAGIWLDTTKSGDGVAFTVLAA